MILTEFGPLPDIASDLQVASQSLQLPVGMEALRSCFHLGREATILSLTNCQLGLVFRTGPPASHGGQVDIKYLVKPNTQFGKWELGKGVMYKCYFS